MQMFHTLPEVDGDDVEEYSALFDLVEFTLDGFIEDEGCTMEEALVSLACFCMEELPNKHRFSRQMADLLECYPTADSYDIARLGHRAYLRMASEIEIMRAEEVDNSPVLV